MLEAPTLPTRDLRDQGGLVMGSHLDRHKWLDLLEHLHQFVESCLSTMRLRLCHTLAGVHGHLSRMLNILQDLYCPLLHSERLLDIVHLSIKTECNYYTSTALIYEPEQY